MNAAGRLAAYGAGLVVAFGGAFAVSNASWSLFTSSHACQRVDGTNESTEYLGVVARTQAKALVRQDKYCADELCDLPTATATSSTDPWEDAERALLSTAPS